MLLRSGLPAVNHASVKLCPVDSPRTTHEEGCAASKKPCSQCEMPDSVVGPNSAAQQVTTKATNPSSTVLKPVGAGSAPHCYSEATECNERPCVDRMVRWQDSGSVLRRPSTRRGLCRVGNLSGVGNLNMTHKAAACKPRRRRAHRKREAATATSHGLLRHCRPSNTLLAIAHTSQSKITRNFNATPTHTSC